MGLTTSRVGSGTFQERSSRAPQYHKENITYSDYAANTSDNTDASVAIYSLPASCGIMGVQAVRITNWDGTDNASIPLAVGFTGSLSCWLASTEQCTDGTEDVLKYEVTATAGIASITAATSVLATLLAVSGENPSTLTGGSTDIYMFVVDFGLLSEGSSQED